MSLRLVAIFYLIMGGLGLAGAHYWIEVNPWTFHGTDFTWWASLGIGAGAGLIIVGLTQLMERSFEWARRLSKGFRDILGPLTVGQCFGIAVFSSIGEELLFRGFLQQAMGGVFGDPTSTTAIAAAVIGSSLLFGLTHIGPDFETFWPWTVMAILMGVVFALTFVWTGSLLAPIATHFTINFLNLLDIVRGEDPEAPAESS